MITKDAVRSLYYLDRDTDLESLVDEIIKVKRSEITIFLKRQQDDLQGKDPGRYYTLEDKLEKKDGELENMQRFFRGAVVPYYARQKWDMWDDSIPGDVLEEATNEIKRSVGFLLYDHTGKLTDEVNSMLTFKLVKDLNEWLKDVETVCFDDNEYIFPDSKHFKDLVNKKGRDAAQRQVIEELREKIKNKHYKREI